MEHSGQAMSHRDISGQAMSHRDNRSYPELLPALPCPVTPPRLRWAKSQLPLGREALPKSSLHPSTSTLGNLRIHPALHKQMVVQPCCQALQHKEVLVTSVNISHPVSQAPLSSPHMEKKSAGTGRTLLKHQWLHQP